MSFIDVTFSTKSFGDIIKDWEMVEEESMSLHWSIRFLVKSSGKEKGTKTVMKSHKRTEAEILKSSLEILEEELWNEGDLII